MLWLLWLPVTLAAPRIFPLVDPGLFVISGVSTCGEGGGYCLLGLDCTLDEDFLPDLGPGQHCEGLRSAFTPSAHFVCCRTATNRPTYKPPLLFPSDPTTEQSSNLNVLENEIDRVVSKVAQSVDSIKVVTTQQSQESDEGDDVTSGMMADSSEAVDESEESSQDDETEESDEDISSQSSHDSTPSETDKPSEEDLSEEASVENTESFENAIPQFHSSEKPFMEIDGSLKADLKPDVKANRTSIEKKDHHDKSEDKSTNFITPEEHSLESHLSKETPLMNEISQEMIANDATDDAEPESGVVTGTATSKPSLNSDGVTATSKPSLNSDGVTATSKPSLNSDEVTPKNQMNKDSELPHAGVNKAPKPPNTEDISSNKASSTTHSPVINTSAIFEITNNTKKQNNSMHNIIKEDKNNPQSGSIKPNATVDEPSQSQKPTDPTEDRFATATTASPGPAVTDNGGGPQGQPGPGPCSTNCSDLLTFQFQNEPLCYGSMFSLDWVVTSASCALRIFRVGMVNVNVSLVDSSVRGVMTIIVHESYGESAGPSGEEIEANNIGLVRMTPGPGHHCLPCLPQVGQLPQENCTAVSPTSRPQSHNCSADGTCEDRATNRRTGGSETCEGPSRLFRDDHGFSYITLACDTPWPRAAVMGEVVPAKPWGRGVPLFCDGVLTAVESSVGAGTVVYTPLSHYLDWLRRNTLPGLPEQHFNLDRDRSIPYSY